MIWEQQRLQRDAWVHDDWQSVKRKPFRSGGYLILTGIIPKLQRVGSLLSGGGIESADGERRLMSVVGCRLCHLCLRDAAIPENHERSIDH